MQTPLARILMIAGIAVAFVVGLFFALNAYIYEKKQGPAPAADYLDAAYLIDGEEVKLDRGVSPDGPVRYFGNDLVRDITGDGRDDVVFLVTKDGGGSGTFFYAVAAMGTLDGYIGSDGYLLGDRIAPQTIGMSPNTRHVDVVAVNYTDRAPGDPMTARPSMGVTAYLKLDPYTARWGVVMPDFEGEAR